MSGETVETETKGSRPRRKPRRWWFWALVPVAAAAAVWGVTTWQERSLQLAEAALQRGELERANELVVDYLVEHPDDGRALALLARAEVAAGRPLRAIDLFQQAGWASTRETHALARAYLMLQRYSEAIPLLEQVVAREPENADAWYELTSSRSRLGLYEQALQSAQRFAELPGNEARGYLFVGTLHIDRNNPTAAIEAFERVLQYEPDAKNLQVRPDELFFQLGRLLSQAGRPAEAIAYLRRSAELLPKADAYAEIGDCYQQLQQWDEAVEAWQTAVEQDPASVRAREALANAALQQSDAQRALRWLAPLESQVNVRSSTAYLLQRAYTLAGNEKAAADWRVRTDELRRKERFAQTIERLLVEDPESFWARIVRAHRFAAAGNWDQAQAIMATLEREGAQDPFYQKLARAVRERSTLPSIEEIPVLQF